VLHWFWQITVGWLGWGQLPPFRSMALAQDIKQAAHLICNARHPIALTGAGISTPSGIPDFRSPASGIWTHVDPAAVASIWAFRRHPEAFFDWVRPLARKIRDAEPNPAHYALAELEAMGYLHCVITQNIDELHQRAGSRRVLEVHGHLRQATCMSCYQIVPVEGLLDKFLEDGHVPRCNCGGVLKPNVVLYGEILPQEVLDEAQREVAQCDLLLVAGSSLEVVPVSDMPLTAIEHSARLIVVNYQPTPVDHLADVVIHANVARVLPRIAAALRKEGKYRRSDNVSG
jgi:NAD-dependent deacetylase